MDDNISLLSKREASRETYRRRVILGICALLGGFPIAALSVNWGVMPTRVVASMVLLEIAVLITGVLAYLRHGTAASVALLTVIAAAAFDGYVLSAATSTAVFFPVLCVALASVLFQRRSAALVTASMVALVAMMVILRLVVHGPEAITPSRVGVLADIDQTRQIWFTGMMDPMVLTLSVGVLGFLWRGRTDAEDAELLEVIDHLVTTRSDLREAASRAERHALRAEHEANQRTRFFSRASHELRTPLNAVLGYTEMMIEEEPPEELAEDLHNIMAAARQQLTLVDDLLTLSTPGVDIQRSTVSFERLASDLRAEFPDTAVPLEIHHPNDTVYTDANAVSSILQALVSNALQFTREGRVEVRFTLTASDLELQVDDTGGGFVGDPDTAFTPFSQSTSSDPRQGAGLGLARAAKLIQALSGTRELKSTPGVGTRITVTLPRRTP